MRTALLLAFAVALSAVAAPVPKPANKTDADLLEGKWVCPARQGVDLSPACSLTFKDGKVTMNIDGEDLPTSMFTLDEATTPKQMDIAVPLVKKPLECIYKIDGDTLTYCYGPRKLTRATEFQSDKNYTCSVFKRVKE